MDNEPRPLVIRHGACRDGFCASWVLSRRFPNAEHFDGFYGQPPPLDLARNRDVVLVDFSYPRPQMLDLANACATMLVLDHHLTAQDALRDFVAPNANVRIVFDMERSGAGLAWDNYYPGQPRPMVVDYVEDRDLWRLELPYTKQVNAYLSTIPFEFDAWTQVEVDAYQDQIEAHSPIVTARERGRWIMAKTEQYVREVCKNARTVEFEGHAVPLVNAPQVDISEVLDRLCVDAPFAMGWWQRADGVFQYGLRSRGGFDVSELAKRHGGGGHKAAAGFQSATLLTWVIRG